MESAHLLGRWLHKTVILQSRCSSFKFFVMKKRFAFLFVSLVIWQFGVTQGYHPTPDNLKAREEFQNDKFGLFIHWGLYSIIGRGEWVLNNDKIKFDNYKKLAAFFNPEAFDPAEWVRMAKNAGMRYITFTTRHHDGFSMWDTRYSDFNIMNTPYKKDILKMLSDECAKQGMKLALYYSTLDWGRDDYPHQTGRTGKHTGRTGQGDYDKYFEFMKNQLTELLTNYGIISGIWLDGHWDQTNPEGDKDRSSRINWRYPELYAHIHSLQPACLIGNNHHLQPFDGEDFQMFERDLPGENKSGLNFQEASEHLPVEVCETLNKNWGFHLDDDNYKSVKDIVHYVVNAAGRNTNLLLNVGPQPDGNIQPEFKERLAKAGEWMKKYGNTIYDTRGLFIQPQPWGVATLKGKSLFIHILEFPTGKSLVVPQWNHKVSHVNDVESGKRVPFKLKAGELTIDLEKVAEAPIDTILEVVLK